MLEKIKNNKYQILELTIIFIITLLYNLICTNFSGDEIWNYGFSYNISNGLIPYKDFNMVITPLFPIMGAIFLTIFGKSLLVYHIFNAIICTTIFYYIKRLMPLSYYITYLLLLICSYPSYNILCILLLYILMILEDKKNNDYIIGIVLGLTFLTKQNIGIFLCVPTIFIKDIKRIIKRLIGFIMPNLILIIYLILNNCYLEFIDYTFLGLISFAKDNLLTNKISLIIILIITILLIYKYIKTKDIKIIYLLSFQLIVFPMVEKYHIIITLIPTIGYLLNNIKVNKQFLSITKKIPLLIFITYIIITFSVNIYAIYQDKYIYPNNTEVYKYRKIPTNLVNTTNYIVDYINLINEELYIISQNSYLIKLEANIEINKYDLLNKGNLGSKGETKIINEIENNCSNKTCIFLLDLDENINSEEIYAKNIKEYIKSEYKRKNIVSNLVVYKNS